MNYSLEEQAEIGLRITKILKLRLAPNEEWDGGVRFQTLWGSKTPLGIFNTIRRIADDIETGKEIQVEQVAS